MNPRRFSRRALLAGLGATAAFLPLLNAHETRADANSGHPKRLILMAWPNGVLPEHFWPNGGNAVADPSSFIIDGGELSALKPLIPHQKDIIVVGGLTYANQKQGGGHASMPFMFTGVEGGPIDGMISDGVPLSAGGPSVDIFIANQIAKRSPLPFHSLQLQCLKHGGNDRFISFKGSTIGGQPNAPEPEVDPAKLFKTLFGGASLDVATLKRIRAERKSVFDYVGGNLESMATRLGSDDRAKVQAHLQAVRDIEKQLDGIGGCTKPGAPDPTQDYPGAYQTPLIPAIQKLQMDMVVSAMKCDLTRVASLLWADSSNGGYSFHWLGDDFVTGRDADDAGSGGNLRQHHEIAHHAGDSPEHTRRKALVDQWFMSQFAYLIQKLKDEPEGDGTMLDNTVILCANIFSHGGSHSFNDLPWVMAGSCGGYFKTGRYLRHVGGIEGESVPQNGLLAALCNAMDVPVTHFGDPQYGGELGILRG